MKKIILLLSLFCISVQAQHVEIDQKSLADYNLVKLKSAPENAQLISWGQGWLETSQLKDNFFVELQNFETSNIIAKADRNFIIDLVEKVSSKADTTQKIKLQTLACKWLALSSEVDTNNWHCLKKNYPLQFLKEKFPDAEYLVAEDMGIQLKDQYSISINEQNIYNWKILSSVNQDISYRGTIDGLLNQKFAQKKIVQGNCASFTHQVDDLEVISRGTVIFSTDCRKNLNQPETSNVRQWYERNRSWVIPVGIAVLAAAAYQLKNKKIIIDKPR